MRPKKPRVTAGWAALLVPFLFYALTLDGKIFSSGVDASIVATQYALWKTGTASIGTAGSLLVYTVDYGVHHGLAYSAIAPGTALLSYPFAAAAFALGGGLLVLPGPVQVADELFLAASASVAAYFFYRMCRLYSDEWVSLFLTLVLAFCTPLWPFTTVVFENAPSLMFSTIGVYFALSSPRNPDKPWLPLLSGLFVGLASFVEYAAALFSVPLAAFEAQRTRSGKNAAAFILGFTLGLTPNLLYNLLVFGNPLLFPEQLKSGTPKPLLGILSAFNPQPIPLHLAYYLASPYRGILFYSPILVAGLYAAYCSLKSGVMRPESALFLTLTAEVLAFYSAWFDWAGGLAYGPRFLTLATPYMLAPLTQHLARWLGGRWRTPLLALAAYSSFIQGLGALTDPFSVSGGPATFQPLAFNLQLLVQGRLDTWWMAAVGITGAISAWAFAAEVYMLVWTTLLLVAQRAQRR